MNFKSILVITYGRSGSTLLQGVLNSIDGVICKGENSFFSYYLYKAYVELTKASQHSGLSNESPWYGAWSLSPENYLKTCSLLIKEQLLTEEESKAYSVFGFKEVHYNKAEVISNLEDLLSFYRKVFPNPCFIFNFRNHDDVLKSGWWKNCDPEVVRGSLVDFEKVAMDYLQNNNNCYKITYEDVVNKTEQLSKLFEFLGVKMDVEKVDNILSKPHSYDLNPANALLKNLKEND